MTVEQLHNFAARGRAAQEAVDRLTHAPGGRFLIWSLEHDAWWRPGEAGYTTTLAEAGVYNARDTHRIVTRANQAAVNECAIPIACVWQEAESHA